MISDISTLSIRPVEERDLEPLARSLGFSRHHLEGRWRDRLAGSDTLLVAGPGRQAVGTVRP